MMKRRLYEDLPNNEHPNFEIDGREIYLLMKKKYPTQSVEDLDNILNGICAALSFLAYGNVPKDDHKNFIQIIWKTLNKNLG